MICGKCGYKINAGDTCPSCGYTNSKSDTDYLARENVKEYNDHKPQPWVVNLSVIGILVNASLIYENAIRLINWHPSTGHSAQYLLDFIQRYTRINLCLSTILVIAFICLLWTRKWALWIIRIVYPINIFVTFFSSFYHFPWQVPIGFVLILVCWFGYWKYYF